MIQSSTTTGAPVTTIERIQLPAVIPKLERPKQYSVVLLNDDYTPMDYVQEMLCRIFKKNSGQAYNIMMDVHTRGSGIAGTFTREVAEEKTLQTMKDARQHGHAFVADLKPA
jgi:ATP-dependent Clp protease adaptor protein ClpS